MRASADAPGIEASRQSLGARAEEATSRPSSCLWQAFCADNSISGYRQSSGRLASLRRRRAADDIALFTVAPPGGHGRGTKAQAEGMAKGIGNDVSVTAAEENGNAASAAATRRRRWQMPIARRQIDRGVTLPPRPRGPEAVVTQAGG